MIARLRRSCLVALCSLPTILPLVAALAAPTAVTACGPAEKKTTTPKKPPPAKGRTSTGGIRPLFSVEVQLWIREVTRLKRLVSGTPGFRWADSPPNDHDDATHELPSVYCTSCGRSGWLGVVNRAGGQGAAAIERLVYDHDTDPYLVSVRDRERTRTMLRANAPEPDVLWLDPASEQPMLFVVTDMAYDTVLEGQLERGGRLSAPRPG